IMVRSLDSFEEYQQVINSGKVVIIDLWATWCGPCRIISPIFEKLVDTGAVPGIEGYKVDVDKQEEIAQAVGVRAMPTFVAFKDGKKVGEVVGANPGALEVRCFTL
ncbi:thioredoxin-like protein, partial [Schizophyllum commune]